MLSSALLVLAFHLSPAQDAPMTAEAARAAIIQNNKEWGQIRLSYDRPAAEKTLTDDFYVLIGENKMTRKEFLDETMTKSENVKLIRFDVDVLTVQKRPDGTWVAVIAEKLEMERTAEGKTEKVYSLWVTKDGWRQADGKWMCAFSEAVGWEGWRKAPPFADWSTAGL